MAKGAEIETSENSQRQIRMIRCLSPETEQMASEPTPLAVIPPADVTALETIYPLVPRHVASRVGVLLAGKSDADAAALAEATKILSVYRPV